ncbi:MAG: FAD-binding oxidoreductase, partial [Actinomycetota bacterium]|nr:FAD-binding oxidoreductase [Actinomycetota bacterium]
GPDVAGLLIGAEGSLGIVTEVSLKVNPIPDAADRVDVCLRFDHMADGVAACRALAQSDVRPTLVRLYDADDATIFLRAHPDEAPGPVLLLSFDGSDASRRASDAVALTEGRRGNDGLVEHWWQHRNAAVDEYVRLMAGDGLLGPSALVDTIEVAGTWSVLRVLYHDMKASLAGEADLVGCHLSHVYPDGACLYFTLASACADDETAAKVHERWWETAMASCLNAGGSITHHHGIGRVKAPWLPDELGGFFDVLVAVKRALDPNNIMNPGVLGL